MPEGVPAWQNRCPWEAAIRKLLKSMPAAGCGVFLAGATAVASPTIGACPVFPPDNIWNTRVDSLPVDASSAQYVASIGAENKLKPDFGSGLYAGVPIGIPYVVVLKRKPKVKIVFAPFADEPDAFGDESDAGPYPVPRNAPIEGGPESIDDRHVLVVQLETCLLYELYKAVPDSKGGWRAVSGARFDLRGNGLRPDGWTSADAAGLPIFPGLVRYDEVEAGEIAHALRFTAPKTRASYVWPARHKASQSDDPALPPLGQRFRLKADVDISGFSPASKVILQALKAYGMILADNGSPWFLSGAPDKGWDNDMLQGELGRLKGSDFEAVDSSSLMVDADQAQAKAP